MVDNSIGIFKFRTDIPQWISCSKPVSTNTAPKPARPTPPTPEPLPVPQPKPQPIPEPEPQPERTPSPEPQPIPEPEIYDPSVIPNSSPCFFLRETASAATARKIAQHPEVYGEDRANYNQLADALEQQGHLEVKYNLHHSVIGRYQPNTFGGTRMWRKARSTLYGDHTIDIDQVSSQPAHLLQLARHVLPTRNDLCGWLADFVADKNAFAEKLGISTAVAKGFILKVCVFGQQIANWFRDAKAEDPETTLTEEMVRIAETACDLRGALLSLKPWGAAFDRQLTAIADESAAKKDKESSGTAKLAHFLQHRERIETERLLRVFADQGIEMVIYCYDGFCVDCHHNAAVRSILAEYNKSSFVQWSVKAWDTPLTFEDLDKPFNMALWRTKKEYPEQKAYFEQSHGIVMETNSLVRKLRDEWVSWRADTTKNIGYKNLHTYITVEEKRKKVGFVDKWLGDDTRLTYDRMDFYPPPLRVPPSTLNTWMTPEILSVPLVDFESFDPSTDPVLQHIKYFSGGDPVMADYITKTLALKVQKPGLKTLTAILAVSKEGAGKTEFILRLASAFWGAKQVLNTTKLEDLCGSFSLLANKIIVVYDEPKSKDTHESAEQLKFLITTTQTEIGAKGIQKTKQQTPGLLFLCSNNVGGKPIQTNEGDRRWVITKCNIPPCVCVGECRKTCRVKRGTGGCKTYFDELYGKWLSYGDSSMEPHPASAPYMRRLYEYLRRMDLSDFDARAIPRSDYHKQLIHDSICIVERFYNELCYAHHHRDNTLSFTATAGQGGTIVQKLPMGEPIGCAWLYSVFEAYVSSSKVMVGKENIMTPLSFWRKFQQQYVGQGIEMVKKVKTRTSRFSEKERSAIIIHTLAEAEAYD